MTEDRVTLVCTEGHTDINLNSRIDRKNKQFYYCNECKDFKQIEVREPYKQMMVRGKKVKYTREKGKLKNVDWVGSGKGE